MRYFVYGTLLDHQVRQIVLGAAAASQLKETPARLYGYRCVTATGVTYPTLRRAPGGEVTGAILDGVSKEIAAKLADYEDDSYRVSTCTVAVEGRQVTARVFVPRGRPAGGPEWDFARWRKMHKSEFLKQIRGE
mgnify:CR=1 FL=1|jgi:gamma-glutamylcyclotransferase (GGCT)/AIG2-like uncharacterized protein YtfP